ncbi:hypothetical protein TNCV_5107321 [Trichonephila clavipes]|nr:hypothetical protein TNCV_5107321 [Trichonephila clavipes]
MNRCPDLVVCLKRDLQCLRPEASLVLIYRPNVAGMKGRVDLAQPVNRTPDLWRGSTIHYHSILFDGQNISDEKQWRTKSAHRWKNCPACCIWIGRNQSTQKVGVEKDWVDPEINDSKQGDLGI